MKQKLELLRVKAMGLIKSPEISDPSTIARLATIPAKLQQMEYQVQQLEDEIVRVEALLEAYSPAQKGQMTPAEPFVRGQKVSSAHNGRSERKKIRIVINWGLLGGAAGHEEICEHMAADTLVKFLTRLYEVRGMDILERLAKLRVNRGFLVSKNPSADYRYRAGSEYGEYQHQPLAGTGFSALTHSDTKQKVGDVMKACQFLGFPAGSVRVDEIGKNDFPPTLAFNS